MSRFQLTHYTWLVGTLILYLLIFPSIFPKNNRYLCDNLYNVNGNHPNIPKHDFRNLLNIATKETFFMSNNKYYKQVDGIAMGSPLGPALANIFVGSFEGKWLRDCPKDFKTVL